MIVFPNAKINLGLRVLEKRDDGFHNIETIFYPVKWCDALEAIPSQKFSFEIKGGLLDGNTEGNLCVKAFRFLQQELKIPPVKMCLLKNIPVGAGLGGGSSDAAFTLKLLNDLLELKLSTEQLRQFGEQLGSDCAFFIENTPCQATGRGNEMQPVNLDLSSNHIIIVYPEIQISTAWAYNLFDPEMQVQSINSEKKLEKIIRQPVESWKEELKNDFEEVVFRHHPEIASIKNQLYELGAAYASMSGSGSAVFGIFSKEFPVISFARAYKIFRGKL